MDEIRADVMRDIINKMFDHFEAVLIEQGKEIAALKRENEHMKLRLNNMERNRNQYIPFPKGPIYYSE
jgi:hypothetical protein